MPTFDVQHVIQNTNSAERVQEALQQQMDTRKRHLQQKNKEDEIQKRNRAEKIEPEDQITIRAERDAKDGGKGNQQKRSDSKDGDAEETDSEKAPRLNITI